MRALLVAFALFGAGCDEGHDYGGPCEATEDCRDGLTCNLAICVITCTQENGYSCPEGFSCVSTREAGAVGTCVKFCSSDDDCSAPFHCSMSHCTVE